MQVKHEEKIGVAYLVVALVALVLGLSGCATAVVSGAGALGYSLAQERSLGDAIDDTTIGTQIRSFYLQKNVDALFNRVGVEVNEGRVLLTGHVTSPDDRVEAVRLAWQPQGVREVINEIVIEKPVEAQQRATDFWISAQVKAKLLIKKEVSSINYTVEVVNGVVYLMGVAQNKEELAMATDIASRVRGVAKVISHVRLKDDPLRY